MKKLLIIPALIVVISLIFLLYKTQTIRHLVEPLFKQKAEESVAAGNIRETFTVISTGDIGLVRYINYQIQQKHDPDYPFAKISGYLKNADLTIANLEGPLIKNCPIIITGFNFCGQDTNIKGLVSAGINAVTLANNHSSNYGLKGLNETVNTLKLNGITPFGLENDIEYLNIKNKKIALVGFVKLGNNWDGLNNATEQNVADLISEAKKNADIVIATFHWGIEYTRKPTPTQVTIAHIAVDNGANLVLGNHPHWIQDTEIYKNIFITYAQGNTIFDQDWSEDTKEGVLYKFEYIKGKLEKVDEKYTVIEQNMQPRFATDSETAFIKQKIAKQTE